MSISSQRLRGSVHLGNLETIEATMSDEILERLHRLESLVVILVERKTVKDYYEVEEFARLVGKAAFTVREWCRLGRIHAAKRISGRGAFAAWVVSHDEFQRYQREGLLPLQRA